MLVSVIVLLLSRVTVVLLGLHRIAVTLVVINRCRLDLQAMLRIWVGRLAMLVRVSERLCIRGLEALSLVVVNWLLNYLMRVFDFASVVLKVVTVLGTGLLRCILKWFLRAILDTIAEG